jgi:hypothetical protein
MRGDQAELERLSYSDREDIRAWLRQQQPGIDQGRSHWWERFIAQALQAMYLSESEAKRQRYARLAFVATEESVGQGATSPEAGAIRVANIAGFYFARGGENQALFDADRLVAQCLSLIGMSIGDARTLSNDWQSLPVADIRRLREAKNLVAACEPLAIRLGDRTLSQRLAEWLELRNDLP